MLLVLIHVVIVMSLGEDFKQCCSRVRYLRGQGQVRVTTFRVRITNWKNNVIFGGTVLTLFKNLEILQSIN